MNNHVEIVTPGTGAVQIELLNYEMAKFVGEILHDLYPGYLWRVNAELDGGIVNVLCADASMEKGMTLMVADLVHEGSAKKHIMRAGGELLERFNLNRGRMIESELVDAKRDLRGNIITTH